jgi:hypothetical protein
MIVVWESVTMLCGLFAVGFGAGYITRSYISQLRRLSRLES